MSSLLKTPGANFPFWRDPHPKPKHTTPILKQESFQLEPLENRLLLSVGLVGVPDWTPEGPAPQISAGNVISSTLATQQDVGGVNALAVDPTNSKHVLAATVNGGIWQTADFTAASPTWTTTTDQMPSLSISAIAFSPVSSNVIYAGTGQFSSNFTGGTAVGVYKSIDGGASWQILNPTDALNPNGIFTGLRINRIIPTALNGGQTVFLSTVDTGTDAIGNPTGGIYRSDDGGASWTRLSGANGLPNGGVTDLVENPNNANQFFAGVPGSGVFELDLGVGTNWANVTNNIAAGDLASSLRIELAISPAGANPVWVSIINNTGFYQRVYRGVAAGGTINWTPVGPVSGGANQPPDILSGNHQGGLHGAIEADPADDTLVYLAGDATNSGAGAGYIVRGDSTANTWTALTPIGVAGDPGTAVPTSNGDTTAPHADSRDMVFASGGVLLYASDGGVYQVTNPASTSMGAQTWTSVNGSLQISEMYNISYDSVFDVILGGDQDTGNPSQIAAGSFTYTDNSGGDGGATAVDNFGPGGITNRYFFGAVRKQYDGANHRVPGDHDASIIPQAGLANFVGFVGSVVNAIAPTAAQLAAGQSTRIVIAGGTNATTPVGAIYESNDAGSGGLTMVGTKFFVNDNWTAIPTGPGFVSVNQISANASSEAVMAYGGRRNGVDNPDVLYAASGNQIFLRSTAGGTLNATAAQPAGIGTITGIALDPNDWMTAFVTDNSRVFMTSDAGAHWTQITGNLTNRVSLNARLAVIPGNGVDAVLFGGSNGVFRMLTTAPGVWSEFGADLPNALVGGMTYNAVADPDGNAANGTGVLVVGTFGHGAWEISNVSATAFSTAVLQITGDTDFSGEDDTIKLIVDDNNPLMLDVFLNGALSQFQLSTIQQINIDGLGGNDTLTVDDSNGLINVANGIRYDGGTGTNDQLQLLQTGGPTRSSDIYDIGSTNGSGTSTISDATGTQVVSFENLAPVLDLVPAGSLTVNATASDNAISYTSGALATEGLVSVDEHEPITFSNKGVLVIDAGGGQDTISLDNPSTPDGLTAILIDGGDPTAGDRVIVTGTGGDVTVGPGFFGTLISGPGVTAPIALFGIESLDLGGIGNLTLNTTAADDTLTVTPGDTTVTGITTGSLQSNALLSQITFANSGSVTADLDGGNDAVVVNGSSTADTVAVSGTEVDISGRSTVTYSNAEALTVNGNAGSDIFNVTPAAAVSIFIDGGDPVGAQPGDQLNILAGGAGVTFNAGPHVDEGSFVVGSDQPVSFAHIESFGITGSGPATINGTNGPDTITVIARDSLYAAGLDGVRDFTVSVNTGPDLLFSDVASLTINALSGSDQITLRTPAPNNAIWNVAVSVDGGPPAADTDRVIVETPGPGAETVLYTPSAADGGLLNLTSLSSPVTLTGVEVLSYDGQNDNDSLTVAGTGIDDTIIHTPGANDQAGSFQVDALLPLSYQNLGGAGSLTVDGGGGTDTLVYNGTAADDLFTVGSAGQVTLNSRLPVGTTSVETLTLQGLQGYDTVSLTGTAGPDSIDITGQAVRINGGMTINANVEDIRLDALGDNDVITYNGVSGVSENIRVSSSGLAGGGQISVPGVTLIDFSGVERIDVNGNVPGSTETDTLTFAGTNAADTFNIHLAAAGTDTDPILQLQNGSGATLLTLRKYTNFNTLNVQGLDGTDNFNVYTAATGPSRNVFIDGGAPTGKKKSTDNLNVFYASPKPRIIHSAATQDPDAGLVDLAYGTARFVVQYDDIEQVVIRKS
jgi:hypothetical protein